MDDLYELKNRIREYMKTVSDVGEALDVEGLKKRRAELAAERETEGFWTDTDRVAAVNREIKSAERKIGRHSELESAVRDLKELADLCEEGNESEAEELRGEIEALSARIDEVRLEALLKGRYDGLNAIVTLHAGAGGTEAQDWTRMLYRMYSRYLERKGFSSRVVDVLEGEEAGLKSVTFTADGENAYGYLKAEKGIHRLVRISPFDSSKRRHTSFASVEVMPEIVNDSEIEIRPEDLKVDTYRSSGAGGQHVNKTESAVRITHLPTGIIVACQNERSQIQNREFAMRMLKSKLAEKREAEQMAEAASIKGNLKKIEWGSQIRSYVFCPYTMVKDHRTNYETADVQGVMDGDIEEFIVEYLKRA